MRHRFVTTALVAAGILAPTVSAYGEYAGFACDYVESAYDAAADRSYGELTFGPWISLDYYPDGPPAAGLDEIRVHCGFQSTATAALPGTSGHDRLLGVHARGTTVVPRQRVELEFVSPDRLYLCTVVEMTRGGQTERFVFDADADRSNGFQCSRIR